MRHEPNCSKPPTEILFPVWRSGGDRENNALRRYLQMRGDKAQFRYWAERARYCPYCDVIERIDNSMAYIPVGRYAALDGSRYHMPGREVQS